MSSLHYKKVCWSCGKVIEQCRCPDPNKTVISAQCDECRARDLTEANLQADAALRGEGEPPEPDLNADGPAERAHRQDEARRSK